MRRARRDYLLGLGSSNTTAREEWIDRAEEHGLKLVTANGDADLSTDGGRMFARIKAALARSEVERKGARQSRQMPRAGAALAGANAAVVGILGAALYTPVFTAGVSGVITLSIAVVCYAALTSWKVPPWAVVVGAALVGWIVL